MEVWLSVSQLHPEIELAWPTGKNSHLPCVCVCVFKGGGGSVVHEDNLRLAKYWKRGGNRRILFFCLLLWIARHKPEVLEIHTTVENFCDAFFFSVFQLLYRSICTYTTNLKIKSVNQVQVMLVNHYPRSANSKVGSEFLTKWEYIPVAFLLPYYYLYPMHYLPVHHPQWEPIWTSPPSVSSHPLVTQDYTSFTHGLTSLPTPLPICTLCACIFWSLSHTPLCMCACILRKSCDLHGPRSWPATYFAGSYIPCDFPFSPPDTSIG